MKRLFTIICIFIINLLQAQSLEVEFPKVYFPFDYKDTMKRELNFDSITQSNNLKYQKKIDPRINTGKYQLTMWSYLTKTPKKCVENTYDYKNELKYINTYLFDSLGNITEYIHTSPTYPNLDTKTSIKYNDYQNIVEIIKYEKSYNHSDLSYSKELKKSEKIIFTYNKNQQLIKEEIENGASTVYTYNELGKIITIEKFGSNGGIIAVAGDISEEELEAYKKEKRSKLLCLYSFEYDDLGNRILEKKEDISNKRVIFKNQYQFGSENNMTKLTTLDFVTEYKYNPNHQITEQIYTQKSEKPKIYKWNYKKGLLIDFQGNSEYNNVVYNELYEYNNKKQVIKINFKETKPYSEPKLYKTEEYFYDESNKLTLIKTTSNNLMEEHYEYDDENRLTHYFRKYINTGEVYDNHIYKYDAFGGLIEDNFNNKKSRIFEYYK